MTPSDEDKYPQIASYISGNSTPAENEQLENWKNSSEENLRIFEATVRVWNNSLQPIEDQAIQDGKQEVKDQIIAQSVTQQRLSRRILWLVGSAAAVLLPLMLMLGWYIGQTNLPGKVLTWNTVTAPKKHIAIVNMADGSEVWLNAGSTLSYPSDNQGDKREVKLSGEGYFKVAKDSKRPFYVITSRATVRVLGTVFNMKAYPAEVNIVTTLEEGSIELTAGLPGSIPSILHPGEQAIFDTQSNKLHISKVDPSLYSSWKGEKYLFRDADLRTILTELERLYDIKIHINNPKLENRRFRGMFSYDEDLLDAFETLKHSVKMSYTIKGREVWLE
ncbi:MAG: FecR domain-containing protein [Prolixibacteraceae bacterium]